LIQREQQAMLATRIPEKYGPVADTGNACNTAVEYFRQGEVTKAVELLELAVSDAYPRQLDAVQHHEFLHAIITLADMYRHQRLHGMAQNILQWALVHSVDPRSEGEEANFDLELNRNAVIETLVQGDELLISLSELLAALFRAKGSHQHLNRAESLLTAVQSAYSIRYGRWHPKTLDCSGNLGYIFAARGEVVEAEKYCRQAYEGFLLISQGDKNNFTITERNADAAAAVQAAYNLSIVLSVAGKFSEASVLDRQVVHWRKEHLGEEDPSTLNAMLSHASVLRHLRQFREAEEIYDSMLGILERQLGPEHEEVRTVLVAMALCKKEAGQEVLAQNLYRRAAKSSGRVLSATSRKVLSAPASAASSPRILNPQGPLSASPGDLNSGPFAQVSRLNSGQSSHGLLCIGEGGLSSLSVAEDAVHALHAVGLLEEAETLCRQVLEFCNERSGTTGGLETAVGDVTVRHLSFMHQLARILEDRKTADSLIEANKLLHVVVTKRTKLLGSSHPDTMDSKNHLASILRNQDRYLEAENLYRHVLQHRRAKYGDKDPLTLTSMVRVRIYILILLESC
jgi:tetratricopeptide (TPR) repeat protein